MKQKRAILLEAVSTGAQATADKQSMLEQDTRLHQLAERFGWKIVDIITVPGHSRVYYTYREFAEDALAEGIAAPMRMFDHWQKRDFDVFACSSGDRFGREQSIFAEVVGRTIDAGAVVHTLRDGEINAGNRRMFISMGGYQAATEIDELVRRHHFGMNKRAERGLPLSPKVPFSHQVIRDERGKAVQMIPREELRPLFNDIARVLLDRVTFQRLEKTLFERYGYVGKNGKPYPSRYFYRHLTSPVWWGHNARNHTRRKLERGAWLIDETQTPPDGVKMFYNTHEPVYTGALGAEVKAEILRRMSLRGSARTDTNYPLSGLFTCGGCGRKMAWVNRYGRWKAARCNTAYGQNPYASAPCDQRKHLVGEYALTYVRQFVSLLFEEADILAALSEQDADPAPVDETPQLEQQLAALEEEGRVLIQKQIRAPAALSVLYDEQINLLGARVETLQTRLDHAKRLKPPESQQANILTAALDIQQMGVQFWEQPPGKVSQTLRRLFAGRLFVVLDGKIVGLKRVT